MAEKPTYEELEQRIKDLEQQVVEGKQTQKSLSETENIRQLLNFAPFGVFLIDLSGKIVAANRKGAERFGRTVEEIIGMYLNEFVPPDIAEKRRRKGWEVIESLEPVSFEDKVEGKWYYNTIFPILDDQGNITHLGVYGSDVSERKRAEGALKKSEDKFRSITENAADYIFIKKKDRRYTFVNQAMQDLLGLPEEEILGKTPGEVFGVEQEDIIKEVDDRAFSGETVNETRSLIIGDKQFFFNTVQTPLTVRDEEITSIMGIVRDVTEQRQVEKALRESEKFLQNVFDAIQDGLSILDLELNIVRVNAWMESMYADEAPLEGKKCYAAYQKRDTPCPWCPTLKTLETGERHSSIVPFPSEEKPTGWIDLSAFPLKDNKTNVVGVIEYVKDITRQKQAENELRRSEEKHRSILENISEGYYEVDLAGNLTFFNDSLVRITGTSRDELLGMNNREYTTPETAEKMYRRYNQIYRTGKYAEMTDFEIIRKDGSVRILNISASLIQNQEGEPIGFRGIVRDVTEEKDREAELVRTKNFLQSILDSSIDGIVTTDFRGKVTYTTPKVKDLLGYDQEETIGKKAEVFYSNGLDDAKAIMKELTEKGELKSHEIKYIKKNGELMDVSLSVSYLRDETGNIVGTLGIYKDITERKRFESQIKHSEKLETIGTLAGGIAHDFNNLLMGIQGRTSLMLMDTESSNPHFEHLKGIQSCVESAANLCNQLLGFAKGGKYAVKATDLNQLVDRSSQMFGRTKKEISIHPRYQKNIWTVEVDQSQIEQVLLNLYVNAWQAMPGGGELYLETEHVILDKNYVKPYLVEPGRYVKISVTDTGVGMDKTTQKKIFDPFFTTKEMGRGTGLGLASAYGIVKNHGGFINVYSKKGQGTTFNIYLPASEKEVVAEKTPYEEVLKGTETVLLVDDEEHMTRTGRKLLEKIGYSVLIAQSGKQAIEIYEKKRDQIDLVILDMIMPVMGGGETYDRLKEANPDIKVLLSSGYSINGEAGEILDRGCNGFIQKPFNLKQLSHKIREILDKK